jgi:hypothetical protein
VSAALRRVNETNWVRWGANWTAEQVRAAYRREFVEAFIDVGRAKDGLDFLAELRFGANPDKALIAQTYWQVGAVREAHELMREAVGAALAEAEADATKPHLPVSITGLQIAMGDRDGGIVALRRLRQFDEPRLKRFRAPLAGRFALAGLDAEAFSLLDGNSADQAVLASIIVGQARRGDFEQAFRTLDSLRKLPPRPPPSPLEFRVFTTSAAVIAILRNAARAADTDAVGRAVNAYREIYPQRPRKEAAFLRDLARVGNGAIALEYALAAQDLKEKVLNLCMVAEGLAGLPDPRYYPLAFLDTW